MGKEEKINHATAIKDELNEIKRKLDAKVENLETEFEESSRELIENENKMKKALESISMTEKELKMEQENSFQKDTALKKKEAVIRDLKMQLEETEDNERRDKKVIREQLEHEVSNLNKELENERQLKKECSDKLKKTERKLKEINNQQDELLKKIEDLQDRNRNLEVAIRTHKQQVEDAEELATLNMAKLKKSRKDVDEAAERANLAEQALSKLKSKLMQ